jgi:hypothetical protein
VRNSNPNNEATAHDLLFRFMSVSFGALGILAVRTSLLDFVFGDGQLRSVLGAFLSVFVILVLGPFISLLASIFFFLFSSFHIFFVPLLLFFAPLNEKKIVPQ